MEWDSIRQIPVMAMLMSRRMTEQTPNQCVYFLGLCCLMTQKGNCPKHSLLQVILWLNMFLFINPFILEKTDFI